MRWNGNFLGSNFAFDTETTDIQPGIVPDLVLWTAHFPESSTTVWGDWTNILDFYMLHMVSPNKIIAHNWPFDFLVLCKQMPEMREALCELVDADKLWDTGILYRLDELRKTGIVPPLWSLQACCEAKLHRKIDKDEEVRTGWSRDVPPTPERLVYALADARNTWDLYETLLHVHDYPRSLTHDIQLKGAIALMDCEYRGVPFNLERQGEFMRACDDDIAAHLEHLVARGYVPKKKGNTKDLQRILTEEETAGDFQLPRLETAAALRKPVRPIATGADELAKFKDKSMFLHHYLAWKETAKLKTFVEKLDQPMIYPRYDTMKNTGRTGSSKPNIQNLPRRPGIRECFEAPPGYCFCLVDYSGIELCTLAQTTYTMFGHSKMRDLINEGKDLHCAFGSEMVGREITKKDKNERQGAKAVNFGLPGGLGPKTLQTTAEANYGVKFSLEECQRLKELWMTTFPECREYLKDRSLESVDWSRGPIEDLGIARACALRILSGHEVSAASGRPYNADLLSWVREDIAVQLGVQGRPFCSELGEELRKVTTKTTTGRLRGQAMYCQSKNTPFQGLAADGAKLALWECFKEGMQIVAFIHDEIITQISIKDLHAHADKKKNLMLAAMQSVVPDVRIEVEISACQRWTKAASLAEKEGRMWPCDVCPVCNGPMILDGKKWRCTNDCK